MPIVPCPRCRADIDVADADLGFAVECPLCHAPFTPSARRPRPDPAFERPSRRRDRFDRDDDEDDYRRPSRRNDADAAAIIARPANAMTWAASIGTALCAVGGLVLAVVGLERFNQGGMGENESSIFFVYAVVIGVFGTALHLPMLIGAHRAKRLEGSGWGVTSAVLGIVSIVTCGPCALLPCFTTGFGIWLLVALNNPEVQRAIRRNRRGRDDRGEDDRDFR